MPQVAFVMSAHPHHPRRELAETLRYELELQGVSASLHLGTFPEPRLGLVYVLMDPSGYVAAHGEQALLEEAVRRRTIFVTEERPPAVDALDRIELLRRAAVVFALDQTAVVALHRAGVPARLLKPGYSASLDHFDTNAARPIDVMFLGTRSLRRTRYLGRAAGVLARHNCLLQVSGEEISTGDTSSFLAKSRWPLLAQTKVLVNLHRGDDARFEWRTALDAIHAGAVVVTEHSSGIAPLVPGEHLLVAGADAVPYVAEALLRDEHRLARLRTAAYERVSTWIPFALSVAVLRAAVVELVGEPIAPPASLRRISEPDPAAIATAPRHLDPRLTAMAQELEQTRGALIDVRRELSVLQDAMAATVDGDLGIELAYESPAWGARQWSRVTVVTPLVGHSDGIVPTLDSLLASRMRDFELVVVADSRRSDAGRAARLWLSGHPRIASQLITAGPPLGAGAARNIGVDFSRSGYCLFLDPGQELFSRCLEVLAGTLDAMSDVAFVYPMQAVIGDADAFVAAGGDYLMSFLGWDPGRLRRGSYIHAPALMRRDRVREIGGFATDPRLAGLEDYDLWCRMAERDWRGQLVSQELARRAESGSSAVLAAINPRPGNAMKMLIDRSPELMREAVPGT